MPLLEGAIAHFVCKVVDPHSAGDHTLHIAEIECLDYWQGAPLLFYTGTYEGLDLWETSYFW